MQCIGDRKAIAYTRYGCFTVYKIAKYKMVAEGLRRRRPEEKMAFSPKRKEPLPYGPEPLPTYHGAKRYHLG